MHVQLTRGDICVEFEDIGEGWSGDYDPTDPADEPLLRFSVLQRASDDTWEQIDDASYCTRVPATTEVTVVERLAAAIMERTYDDAASGASIKKTCEELSWLTPQEAPADKYNWEID